MKLNVEFTKREKHFIYTLSRTIFLLIFVAFNILLGSYLDINSIVYWLLMIWIAVGTYVLLSYFFTSKKHS